MSRHLLAVLLVTVTVTLLLWPLSAHAAVAPTLSSTTVYWNATDVDSSVKASTAKLGATISADGGEPIIERGIVWSTSDPTPTIGEAGVNKLVLPGTATGTFSGTVTGLSSSSPIYFQGYATNSTDTGYSGVSPMYTETGSVSISGTSGVGYFEFTADFPIPDGDVEGADAGVVIVVRQNYTISKAPYDGTVYIPNARFGLADTTDPNCMFYCEAVVADEPAVSGGGLGSVTITGLKEGFNYYVAAFTYNGSGPGVTGINYTRTINATGPVTTTTVPLAGTSHNELYVAAAANPWDGSTVGTMTSSDCSFCHAKHHSADPLLPRTSDQFTKCATCHNPGGYAPRPAISPSPNIALHPTDESVDCGSCHSMHSFRTEELYSTDPDANRAFNLSFVRKNMTKYINPTDYPPPGGGGSKTALSNTVFQDRTTDFAFKFDAAVTSYNAVCQTCHTATDHHRQTMATGDSWADDHHVNADETNDDCATCHQHQTGFAAGGHTADFGKDAVCTRCHTGAKVMEDIHGDGSAADCTICHSGSPSSSNLQLGDATNGVDGDARLASGLASPSSWGSVTCLTCHPTDGDGGAFNTKAQAHHDASPNSYANDGLCEQCHDDPRVGKYDKSAQSKQLACRACHVQVNGTTLEIVAITYAKQDSAAATGDDSGNTYTPVTPGNGYSADHSFANTNATDETDAIDNYGTCFECHGTIGSPTPTVYDTATNPAPYHALPLAGAYNASINTIGGNGWANNLNASGTLANFRGNQNHSTSSVDSYFPIGKGRLNVGYANHSLIKGATAAVYKTQNTSAQDTYAVLATNLVFSVQVVDHLGLSFAVPHFDAICDSTSTVPCDDITDITISQVKDGGTTLGFDLSATSSDPSPPQLHIVWGGVEIGQIASGGTLQFRWRPTDKNDPIDGVYCLDQFNPGNVQPIWVVSELGGSADSASFSQTPYLRGTSTSTMPSGAGTCVRVTTAPSW